MLVQLFACASNFHHEKHLRNEKQQPPVFLLGAGCTLAEGGGKLRQDGAVAGQLRSKQAEIEQT